MENHRTGAEPHANVCLSTAIGETLLWRPCPLCGSREFSAWFDTIKRCRGCGLSLVNPLGPYRGENETRDYFLNDYLPLHLSNRENSLAERRAHIAMIQKYFKVPERPRHLDVGCALGFMLQEAAAVGWESSGVETSQFAAQYAQEHTGCPVYAGTLNEAAFPSAHFDVVTLMDVIEHVPHPCELISEIHRILRPRGVLFIVTPNLGSLFVRLYGPKAYGVWPDQHIVYFRPSTMLRLLRNVGFSRTIVGTKDFYSHNVNRLLRRNGTHIGDIKKSFGAHSRMGRLRECVNRCFMHVRLGDKLIALAQK